MQKILIAHFLDEVSEGEFGDLPPHITIVRPFWISDYRQFLNILNGARNLVRAVAPIPYSLGEFALFGVRNDVPVTRVVHSSALQSLHLSFLQEVKRAGGLLDERAEWRGWGYNPHIAHTDTFQGEGRPDSQIDSVSVVVKISDDPVQWAICETLRLEVQESLK